MSAYREAQAHFVHNDPGKVHWKRAAKIGFFVGCIFLLATAGNPWGLSALIVPTVMGREVFPSHTSHFSMGFTFVHLALAIVFGLAMAPVLQRLKIMGAILVSIPFGFFFYVLNVALFRFFLPNHGDSGEIGVVFTNVAFALLVAAAYRGLARGDQKIK